MSIMARQPRCLLHGGSIETSQEECSLCRDLATLTVPPRTITKEEEAVMEVAGRAANVFAHWESLGAQGWEDDNKLVEVLRDLKEVVDALNAPKPVKPEEVEPGTRFRFFQDGVPRACELPTGTYRLIGVWQPIGSRMWLEDDGMASFFHDEDRIIPLPDEEQP